MCARLWEGRQGKPFDVLDRNLDTWTIIRSDSLQENVLALNSLHHRLLLRHLKSLKMKGAISRRRAQLNELAKRFILRFIFKVHIQVHIKVHIYLYKKFVLLNKSLV